MENESKSSLNDESQNKLKIIDRYANASPDTLNNLQLDVVGNSENAITVLKHLTKSGVLKAKNAEEALVFYQMSRELNLPFITAMSHMQIINGKLGTDVHILKALVLRAGSVTWDKTKDYEPQYEYTDKTRKFYLSPLNIPEQYKVIPLGLPTDVGKKLVEDTLLSGKIPIYRTNNNFINYATEYVFKRIKKNIKGEWIEITETSSFSSIDKLQAGLGLKADGTIATDSPWYKYEKLMQDHRSWTFGARAIASDLLFQLYSKYELYDVENVSYTISDGDMNV